MNPYAELLEFNQPNPIRLEGFTRIRDQFPGLKDFRNWKGETSGIGRPGDEYFYDPERIMEFAGRWDYGENNARKLGETVRVFNPQDSSPTYLRTEIEVPIIQKYIAMGHESMIEMGDATFFIECSRVVSHELVRHRLVSYQQESQRFVKYDDSFNPMTEMYSPFEFGTSEHGAWMEAMSYAFEKYKRLMEKYGQSKQLARYVLPNAMRTRLIMKTNVREWRHIIGLRLDKSAQPEMRELMQQVYDQLVMVFPNALSGLLDNGRGVR